MARKIFVSYKYADRGVFPLEHIQGVTTARQYVDFLHDHLDANDYIVKGENDEESLAGFKDEWIASKLRDKIYDSSITVVLISKNMKDPIISEADQWIPWEVSYSLREKTRVGRTSKTNAVLAVVLPDESGSYEYFVEPIGCLDCGGVNWKQDWLFEVLGKNMFNRKNKKTFVCTTGICGTLHQGNDHSYIYPIKWNQFISNINLWLDHAVSINQNIDDYELVKIVI